MRPEDKEGCSEMVLQPPPPSRDRRPIGLTLLAESRVMSPTISPSPPVFGFYHILDSFHSDPTAIYLYPLLLVYLGT